MEKISKKSIHLRFAENAENAVLITNYVKTIVQKS